MASGDATAIPVKNQAYRISFPILDADGDLVTGATGLDSEVSKDGGTFADVTAEATEIATSSGMYFLDLTAAEMNADTVAIIVKTSSSGAKTTPIVLYPNEDGDIDVSLSAQGKSDIWDEALSGHQVQGSAGAALTMAAYPGSYGPGVYIDDGAANTGTTLGDDGTVENPVSTIAAATTIAVALGVKRFYLINNTAITLAQTYEDYQFIGIGLSNQVTLGSQDVDNTEFFNVTLTGTQGGTQMMQADFCRLQAILSAEIIAYGCWLTGDVTMRAATNQSFDACKSAVPGGGTPDLIFPGSGTTSVNFRHYSGGLTVKNATVNDTMSYETDGQLIIDATCTSLTIHVRGNCTITDNGTTSAITQDAAVTTVTVADAVLIRAISNVEPAASVRSLYGAVAGLVNKREISGTDILLYASDDTTVIATIPITVDATLDPIKTIDPP